MENEAEEAALMLGGRIAIVTGPGGGLGRSHALQLARLGAKILVHDNSIALAEQVAREIERAGGEAIAFAASVSDEARIDDTVARAMDAWGRVDILVDNAGILRDKSFAKMTMAEFRDVIDVHLMGSAIWHEGCVGDHARAAAWARRDDHVVLRALRQFGQRITARPRWGSSA